MRDETSKRTALVEALQRAGLLKTKPVIEAMQGIPREHFVPTFLSHRAYDDQPISIGFGQTISAPHMVAIMTEALDVRPGMRVLEIGSGSGYQAAVLERLVQPGGHVVTIERIGALAGRARNALARCGATHVEVRQGDGSIGDASGAPWDRILVAAAAPEVPPPLVDQLAADGMLLVPVGDQRCDLIRVRKRGDEPVSESLGACAFVPLIGAYGRDVASIGG